MSIANALTGIAVGIEGFPVNAEARITPGTPGLHLTGLHGREREVRDRVRAAVINSGLEWPRRHIAVTLYPASLTKRWWGLDLAIAVSILTAAEGIPRDGVDDAMFAAGLGLDGALHPVPGVLPVACAAAEQGVSTIVVAPGNAAEAAAVPGLRVLAPRTLDELAARQRASRWLRSSDGRPDVAPREDEQHRPMLGTRRRTAPVELARVPVPAEVRRAVEVAAAGGHHMLVAATRDAPARAPLAAEALAAVLPKLDEAEALTNAAIRSVAEALDPAAPLSHEPPFEDVHHTMAHPATLTGSITRPGALRPGLMPLTHRGVLVVDDAPELPQAAVGALHRALEDGEVRLTGRTGGFVTLPARFQLLLGAGTCGCRAAHHRQKCVCPAVVRRKYPLGYLGRLTDHIAVRTVMRPQPGRSRDAEGESTAAVAGRVADARARTRTRLAGTPWRTNEDVPRSALLRRFLPGELAMRTLDREGEHLCPVREHVHVLRLAWTLADLAGIPSPGPAQVKEAIELYRMPPEITRPDEH